LRAVLVLGAALARVGVAGHAEVRPRVAQMPALGARGAVAVALAVVQDADGPAAGAAAGAAAAADDDVVAVGAGRCVEGRLGEEVALKLLLPGGAVDPTNRERFLHEAKASRRIMSEHVARVSDFGTLETGAPFMVMELLEGEDLGKVIRARRKLPVAEAVD